MLTLSPRSIDNRNTNTDTVAVEKIPAQYAFLNASILSSITDFQSNLQSLSYGAMGQSATDTLLGIADGFLRNGIAVNDIIEFSSLSLQERGIHQAELSQELKLAFEQHIAIHAPAVVDLPDFILSLEENGGHSGASVRLTPYFTFACGMLHDSLADHPLYTSIRQFCFHLAHALGVCDDIDMVERIRSEYEDLATVVDKQGFLASFDAISEDIEAYNDQHEQALSFDQLNEKWGAYITFEEDWFSPTLMNSIQYSLTASTTERLSIDQLEKGLISDIEALDLQQDPIAIQLLKDIAYIRSSDNTQSSMMNDGDDSLFNSLILLSLPYDKLSEELVEQLDIIGNDVWQNGLDTYFTIDLSNPSWCKDLETFSQVWSIVSTYIDVSY
jgi:hypothetical protein